MRFETRQPRACMRQLRLNDLVLGRPRMSPPVAAWFLTAREGAMGCGCADSSDSGDRAARRPRNRLCRIWHILTDEKTPRGDPCVVFPGHVLHKPDPCIYDQFLLMQLNKPVTWDNPDVRIFLA